MTHEPTEEQRSIHEFVRTERGNLVIDALAGSGKSYTLLESLKVIPQRSILMAAFNKRIAEDLQRKLPKLPRTHAVHVKTFHSLGLGILKASHPRLELQTSATEDLVKRVCEGRSVSFQTRRYIGRLVRLLKETTVERAPEPEEILELASNYEVFGAKATEDDMETAIDRTLAAYEVSQDVANLTSIDFCDMIWLPVILNLPPSSRYQAVVIDELQDISEPQFALLQHVMLPTTRVIAVGDRRQAIYGWRGGMGEKAWELMQDHFKAETRWLTTTFRCSTHVVAQANRVLHMRGDMAEHALKAMPDANEGTVTTIPLADLPHQFVGGLSDVVHTFVLSRLNDTLLKCALFLHRNRVKFQLIGGKDMLAPLFELLDYKLDLRSSELFMSSLTKWKGEQLAKAEKIGSWSMTERIEEQVRMLNAAHESTGYKPTHIKGLLGAVLSDNKSGVHLMTVHKAKGLEAERVFLLKQSFASHNRPLVEMVGGVRHESIHEASTEELNIEYVAITRAKEHLVWVDMDPTAKATVSVDEAIDGLTKLGEQHIKNAGTAVLEMQFARAEREAQRLESLDAKASEHWTLYAGKLLTELQLRVKESK